MSYIHTSYVLKGLSTSIALKGLNIHSTSYQYRALQKITNAWGEKQKKKKSLQKSVQVLGTREELNFPIRMLKQCAYQ